MVYAKNNKPNTKNLMKEDKKIKETTGLNSGKISRTIKDLNGLCRIYWARERTTFPKAAYENIPKIWCEGGRVIP